MWSGTVTNPTVGNSSVSYNFGMNGNYCKVTIQVIIGSTFVAGSGLYGFSMPYLATGNATGTITIVPPSGNTIVGATTLSAGSSTMYSILQGTTGNWSQATTLNPNTVIYIDITYPVI